MVLVSANEAREGETEMYLVKRRGQVVEEWALCAALRKNWRGSLWATEPTGYKASVCEEYSGGEIMWTHEKGFKTLDAAVAWLSKILGKESKVARHLCS